MVQNGLKSEDFKEDICEMGYIVKLALQNGVLARGAVEEFLSHCEWNSTLESICKEIPMICKLYSRNQRVNARYVSHVWKVGLELESVLERGEIETYGG